MTETKPTSPPVECLDACTEHHTYGPDCAAPAADYDPNAGMRERYIEALYQAGETRAFAPYLDREQAGELADAVLAARDVHLNNVRRISKQQTTQLAELYVASQRRAVRIQTLLDEQRDRVRKLHRNDGALCTECSTDQRGALWPCNTVDALEPLKETQ